VHRTDASPGPWLRPLAAVVALALGLALVLAACGAASSFQDVGDELAEGEPAQRGDGAPEPVDGSEETGGGPGSAPDGADAAPVEQRIIKTGEVTLEVADVGSALGRVRAMATDLGGYVGGSQAGTLDDRATLTLRIPATRFDEALARLHEMDATLLAESTREEDVTGQIVDLEARIANLEASEATYRALVERAEEIEDILAVQSRLDAVRGEIEQLQAQLEALAGRADLSTLTVSLVPRAQPVETQAAGWDPGGQLARALATLVGIGQGIADGLIWFVVVWLPVLMVLGIVGLVALRGVLEVRRRMPAGGGGSGAATE
jgi:hypothetical protein